MAKFEAGQSGNPKGRPRKSARQDGWSSILTGLGLGRDKRTSVSFCADVVTDDEARELWRGDDLSARAVESYPDEMLRAGYDISIQAEDDDGADEARETSEATEEVLKRLGADESMRSGMCFERAYGGGAVFPVINDLAGDLARPLNENAITELRDLVVFEARELQALTYYNDPLSSKYGRPERYTLQPIGPAGSASSGVGKVIHESRLIVFPGKTVSRATVARVRPGWGDSVLTLVRDTIRDFNGGFASVNHLLQDFSQAVMSIRGLHDAVVADEKDLIKGRFEVMDMARSVLRMMLLDAGSNGQAAETFQRVSTPISGVAEVLDRMIYRLASALEMPATLLMGMSPAGLSATGASDIRLFYDRVAQKQDRHLRPRLERLVQLVFLSKAGPTKGITPDKWCVEFCPLWQPSQKEVVDARLVQATIDEKYINLGLPAEDVFKSRFGGDGYSYDTKVDLAALEAMEQAVAPPAPPVAPGVPAVEPEADDGEE